MEQQPLYYDTPPAPKKPMKWHNFLIYFALWLAALVMIFNAYRFFTGKIEGSAADVRYIYSLWPELKGIHTVMGILCTGAAVLALEEDAEYYSVVGSRGDLAIQVGGPLRDIHMTMDGQSVFRFAVSTLPMCVDKLLEKSGLTLEDVDWVVCHQANQRIIDASIRRLGVPAEKFYKNLDRFANTSAASVPLAIAEMKESGKLVSGQRVIMVGFGGGLTWAGVMMQA